LDEVCLSLPGKILHRCSISQLIWRAVHLNAAG
jgi:hypothetical protein